MNESKNDFLASLRKDLEKELGHLKREKREEKEKYQKEIREIMRKELESKFKQFYYWLFGIALVLLLIILGVFFYLRSSLGK